MVHGASEGEAGCDHGRVMERSCNTIITEEKTKNDASMNQNNQYIDQDIKNNET